MQKPAVSLLVSLLMPYISINIELVYIFDILENKKKSPV